MSLETIAILSPEDIGRGIGKRARGARVRRDNVPDRQEPPDQGSGGRWRVSSTFPSSRPIIVRADLIMAILVPAQAVSVAKEATAPMRTTGASRPFGDCNAVSPMSASVMASIIGATGGDYIDGGIIGSSPAKRVAPRVYTPGPRPDLMDELDGKSIAVRNMVP